MINQESKHVKGPNDTAGGLDFVAELTIKGKNPFLKYDLANLLADLYPKLSSELKHEALVAVFDSFTPSSFEKTGFELLSTALLRMGPGSIEYFIQLGNHENDLVRCGAISVLVSTADDATTGTPPAPGLNCSESPDTRQASLRAWEAWWKQNRGQVSFQPPTSPYNLDVPQRP